MVSTAEELLSRLKRSPTEEELKDLRQLHANKFGAKIEGDSLSAAYGRIFGKKARRLGIQLSTDFIEKVRSLDQVETQEERDAILHTLWGLAAEGFPTMTPAQHTVYFSEEQKARIQAEAIHNSGLSKSGSSSVVSPTPTMKNQW